jgi:ribosome-associated translation inhibitor RaiA
MQMPLQISFRNMDPSPAVEAIVREKAAKLDRFFERIVSCEATIEAASPITTRASLYKVRIDIGMPGNAVPR